MNLNPEEYELIRQRMLTYKIIYQEIYHEILDHVTSAIESRRDSSDLRAVNIILEELIVTELGGTAGIAKIARDQERLYRLKIHRRTFRVYGHRIVWKVLLSTFLIVLLDSLIPTPAKENYTIVLYTMILLLPMSAGIYVMIKMRSIKTMNKKQSLVKNNIRQQVFLPFLFVNLVFTIPNTITMFTSLNAKAFMKVHPAIPLVLLFGIAFYIASCYKVMQEEIAAN